MKQQFKMSLVACLAAAMCCAGCAKHELVKQDQMIPAASPAVAKLPAISAAPDTVQPTMKDAAIAKSSTNQSQAQGLATPDTVAKAAKDGALQATLEKVFFDFNSPTLSPEARAVLAKNAETLKQKASAKVRIEGNCDELGSDDYNLALGESRAKSAMHYLQSLGIQSERLSVISYGKEKPAASGHDEASRAKNRRDEFVITSN